MRIYPFLIGFLAFASRVASGQTGGAVIVHLTSADGSPVAGARVEVGQAGVGASAGIDGRAVLRLPRGTHEGLVTAMGFVPRPLRLVVGGADSVRVRVTMERTALSLAAVTVTAAPTARGLSEVAAAVGTMDARTIERSLASTLAGTLGRQAGVAVRSQGPAASMPVIRGLTGDRIVVLQDGQRASDLAASAPDHGITVDPLAARSIEIVRGPAALLYGSNALGGVVNVISDDIPAVIPAQRTTSLALSTESASRGGGGRAEVVQPLGHHLALAVKAGGRSHEDQRLPAGDRLGNTSARNRSVVIGAGAARDGWSGGLAWRRYGFEYGLPYRSSPDEGVRLRGARQEVTARAVLPGIGRIASTRIDAGWQRYAHDEVVANGDVATTLGLATRQLQVIGALRPIGVASNGAVGLTLSRRANGVTGEQALTPPSEVGQAGFVLFEELRAHERLRFPVSARLERTSVRALGSDRFGPARSRRFDAVSASGGVVWSLAPGSSVAFSAARAVRAPSVEELFSRAGHAGTGAYEIGNPSLSPEVTRGLDLVWRVERSGVRAQLAGYHSDVDGWIGMYPTGRDTTVTVGEVTKVLPLFTVSQRPARLTGMEFELERVVRQHLVLGVVGDLVHGRDDQGEALPFMPGARLGGHVRYDNRRFQYGASLRQQARQGAVPTGEYQAPGYTQVDAFAGVTWFAGPAIHGVLLRVDNAGNRLTRDATSRAKDYAPNAGRNVTLTYRLSF